jgi:hypothetical protein
MASFSAHEEFVAVMQYEIFRTPGGACRGHLVRGLVASIMPDTEIRPPFGTHSAWPKDEKDLSD